MVPLLVLRDKVPSSCTELLALRRRHSSLEPAERLERALARSIVVDLQEALSPLEAATAPRAS